MILHTIIKYDKVMYLRYNILWYVWYGSKIIRLCHTISYCIIYNMISYDNLILYCVIMLHYGIVSHEMTLFCMICYDKIMYCINTILCHTITLANKFDILIFS